MTAEYGFEPGLAVMVSDHSDPGKIRYYVRKADPVESLINYAQTAATVEEGIEDVWKHAYCELVKNHNMDDVVIDHNIMKETTRYVCEYLANKKMQQSGKTLQDPPKTLKRAH